MNTFEEVYTQFEPMIFHMIRKLNIRQDHDIYVQEGMLSLWRAWEKFDSTQGEFAPYAYQCIRGGMLTYMRKDNRYKEKEIVRSEAYWDMRTDGELDKHLEQDTLQEFAELLTSTQQKWFWLTFQEQLTVVEIAEQEGVSLSAVKKWRKGALGRIRMRELA